MNLKKKLLALGLSLAMVLSLAACGQKAAEEEPAEQPAQTEEPAAETPDFTPAAFKIAALKGPTAMGLVELMSLSDTANEMMEGKEDVVSTGNTYEFTLAGSADEVTPALIKGDLDMACVPANLAAVLYGKTDGAVEVLAVNTLGVLYIVENGDAVQSMADLAGKKILAAGQGSTPEYVINYLLEKNGLTDSVQVEYVSEHAEAVTQMAAGGADLILVPEPFVTTALSKVEGARVALDLTQEWAKVSDADMVMGCLVVSKTFAQEHPDALDAFMDDYAASADYCTSHPAEAAALIEKFGIMGSAALAEKAIPNCNIVCVTGQEMADMVTGMLTVLFDANPKSVGGSLPGEEMFYLG